MTGLAWSGTITYAFPTSASDYSYDKEASNGFDAVTQAMKTAVLFAIETDDGNSANDAFSVEGFTNADFELGSTTTSTLRFAQSNEPSTAYAYLPTTAAQGGDMWFGRNYDYTNSQAGNYAWHTILHEIGHALGLKHPHEKYGTFGVMSTATDSVENTVMSYRAYTGANVKTGYTYASTSAPQTYMMGDIAALQKMYGADYTTNSDNTIYSWDPTSGDTLINGDVAIDASGNVIFATIWDGGGTDTYDLSAYTTDLKINLDAGKSSYFSASQIATLGNKKYAAGNIYNALLYDKNTASLIENAFGGSGNDIIYGNVLGNFISSNSGNDKVYGLDGDDFLAGGAGNTYFDGGNGNDVIEVSGAGTRTLIGGAGDDNILADYTTGTNKITDTAGNNYIYGGSGLDTITTGAGNDTIVDVGGGAIINSGSGNDSIYGGSGNDKITAGAGINIVYSGTGDDTITGGAQSDYIAGGDGNDSINAGAGVNTIYGEAGNDSIIGGAAIDTIYGGNDDDFVKAGGGNDYVEGGAGNDTLYADAGNDKITGGDGDDKIYGVSGTNYLLGDAGSDTITGGSATDTIAGGDGADFIVGGAGNDIITGDAGADSIRGGAGNDMLTGGADADVFLFEKAMGRDTITDFNYSEDKLQFDFAAWETTFANYAKQVGENVIVTFASTAVLTLKGFDLSHVEDVLFA